MKNLLECIEDSIFENMMILERNEKMFPSGRDRSKFEIWTEDHCRERQKERDVTDKEITSAFFGAWEELNKLFKEREIEVNKPGKEPTSFNIIDARKDRNKPVCIAAFIYSNRDDHKLYHPAFTVKTVYKGEDFSGATKSNYKAKKIFLY